MLSHSNNFPARGFLTPPPTWNHKASFPPSAPISERKQPMANKDDFFRVLHKIPAGDSPYVRAKRVQLIDKDPSRAIPLFWGAINAGDRVDSALKDMAVVMKQLNRSDEAIEAIKSFRHLCHQESQESLDNVLIELYKRSGRLDEHIEMIQYKLKAIDDGIAFEGKRTKTARSQGKKIEITIKQEKARLLGNLAWAYLQQGNHITAGELYKQALALESDRNKECNLAICLMYMNKVKEAKAIIHAMKVSSRKGRMDDSYAKSFERAYQMLIELEANSFPDPNEQDGHEEKKRYLKSPVPRHSTQDNSSVNGEKRQATWQQEETVFLDKPNRISHFQSQFENKNNFSQPEEESSRCGDLRLSSAESPQILCADKWKKGAQLENPVERSDISGRRNGNWVSATEKVRSAQRRAYGSPLSVGGNSKFPSTEQRRGSCFLSKGDQRNSIFRGNTADCPSYKLPVEDSKASEARQLASQNLDGCLQTSSSNENLKIAFQRSEKSLPSPGGTWGGITQEESEVMMESISHSTLNRYGKWNSWGSDECPQSKNEEATKSSSQPVANGKREGKYWGNVELKQYQMKDSNQSPCMQMKSPIARAATPVTSNDVQPVTDGYKKRNFCENDKQKNFRTKESNLSPSIQLKSPASVRQAVAPASFNDGETIKFTLKESNLSPSMQLKSPASVQKAASPISFNDGEAIKFMMKGSKSSPCMQLESPTLDKATSRATFSDGESWEQGSDSQVMRDVKLTYSFGEKGFRRNSGKLSENKKSWADMVEEEEQELLGGITDFLESKLDCIYQKPTFSFRTPKKWSGCWSNGEDFNDENLNSNIFRQTPPSQPEIDNMSHKLEVFDMKDGYCTPGSDSSSRNKPTNVRRSLCFDQQQEAPCPSQLPKKGMNSEGCKFAPASECNSGSSMRPKRRNRLQVFQDITLHTESSPRT